MANIEMKVRVKICERTQDRAGNTVFHTLVEDSINHKNTYIPVVKHRLRGMLVVPEPEEAMKVREGEPNNFCGMPVLDTEKQCYPADEMLAEKAVERVYRQIYS